MIQLEGLPFYIINIVNVGGTKRWESVLEQDEYKSNHQEPFTTDLKPV